MISRQRVKYRKVVVARLNAWERPLNSSVAQLFISGSPFRKSRLNIGWKFIYYILPGIPAETIMTLPNVLGISYESSQLQNPYNFQTPGCIGL